MVKREKSIVIIICYYGEFPWYFQYFLHSCKYNSGIDIIIITDNDYNIEVPKNVKIIKSTFYEIKKMMTDKLNIRVNFDNPYKLCDFKPAYGIIFSEYIERYDFWGHGDIDIIYGDIRYFMKDKVLNEFDYISVRHDFTSGFFALYKNNNQINNIFKQSRDYKKVFLSEDYYGFDECNFKQDLLASGKSIFDVDTEIESFTYVIKSAERNKEIRAHFDFLLMEGFPGRLKFDHGKLIYKNTFEVMMYHLYWFKRIYNPKSLPRIIPDLYHISSTRIYT